MILYHGIIRRLGYFSVRSCYHLEWAHQHGNKLRRTSEFGSSSMLPVWKTLRYLNVPGKIKIHCWRVLLGAIPCNGVLANRHMKPSSQCQLCMTDCESVHHALFTCPRVNDILQLLGLHELTTQVCSFKSDDGHALEALFRDRSAKAPLIPEVDRNDLVATTVCYVWWERRQATRGETVQSPTRSA
jgi:hypothetical protein